jgi:hypothetical protein
MMIFININIIMPCGGLSTHHGDDDDFIRTLLAALVFVKKSGSTDV